MFNCSRSDQKWVIGIIVLGPDDIEFEGPRLPIGWRIGCSGAAGGVISPGDESEASEGSSRSPQEDFKGEEAYVEQRKYCVPPNRDQKLKLWLWDLGFNNVCSLHVR